MNFKFLNEWAPSMCPTTAPGASAAVYSKKNNKIITQEEVNKCMEVISESFNKDACGINPLLYTEEELEEIAELHKALEKVVDDHPMDEVMIRYIYESD
jgi:hypothetical protein